MRVGLGGVGHPADCDAVSDAKSSNGMVLTVERQLAKVVVHRDRLEDDVLVLVAQRDPLFPHIKHPGNKLLFMDMQATAEALV